MAPSTRSGPRAPLPPLLQDVALVIFDFDGVIADSEVISLGTLRETLEAHGLPLSPEEVRDRFLGTSLDTITKYVARHSPRGTAEGFAAAWQESLFAQFRSRLQPIPLILPMLDMLRDHGIRRCVASSSSFERIGVALDALSLTDRFTDVFSAEQVRNGKPAPDLFRFAAENMAEDPAACLVIEDSPHGVKAARAAGMRVIGLLAGAHLKGIEIAHARLLKEAGAQTVLQSYADLLPPPAS